MEWIIWVIAYKFNNLEQLNVLIIMVFVLIKHNRNVNKFFLMMIIVFIMEIVLIFLIIYIHMQQEKMKIINVYKLIKLQPLNALTNQIIVYKNNNNNVYIQLIQIIAFQMVNAGISMV